MQELTWMDHVVGGTLESGIDLASRLGWDISVTDNGRQWQVWAGDQVILQTDSRQAVESFLYGMALSYSILPEPILARIREEYRP